VVVAAGRTLPPQYQPLEVLGRGAFGVVYSAIDTRRHQKVAVKELVRGEAASLARFKQEFRALTDIHHPNVVGLRELLEHEGAWFIVMELVGGVDFIRWVRPSRAGDDRVGQQLDVPRLRAALGHVADGLTALHHHGVVHRDLKPSNIHVTPEGRAVLLDFGLVTTLEADGQSTHANGVGTPAYMAPEQAASKKLGPEADWYAVGACLYQALTGRPPFDGAGPLQMMLQKQTQRPILPAQDSGLPEDLRALCMHLLEPDPRARAGVEHVRRAVEVLDTQPAIRAPRPSPTGFAGREGELVHLERAFEQTQQGELGLVIIEGESGVGKSALAAELVRRLRAQHSDMLVLTGRCYENEQVAFKAFDGCMDELAKVLRKLPGAQCAALLPRRAALLAQLFPVLRSVESVARAPTRDVSADPTARRLEAFAALAALLGKLAEERPVVLVIDDLQWADPESFRLLRALVEGDRPPILLVCTARPRSELDADVLASLDVVRAWHCTEVLGLLGLPLQQAHDLAELLLGPGAPESILRSLAHESRGHPLFMSELAHYASSHDIRASGAVTLDAALAARIRELDRSARGLLELIAVGGRPYPTNVFAMALGDPSALEISLKALLALRLVRTRRAEEVVCFHDRIREVSVQQIPSVQLRDRHERLAQALERWGEADPSELAWHWDRADRLDKALSAYEVAASRALDALAFARAERLYARALEILGDARDGSWQALTVQRGHALARAGRSAEAANAYELAADAAEGDRRARLRVAAAQQLIQSAQIRDGMRAASSALLELGLSMPTTTSRALARILWDRARVGLRGLAVEVRGAADVAPRARLELDALSELGFPVTWVELVSGSALNTQHLRLALRHGEPAHAVRALAQEAAFRAMQRAEPSASYQVLFERSREMLVGRDEPALSAHLAFMEANAAAFRWDPAFARERLETAQDLVQRRCPGEPWLLTNIRMNLGAMLLQQGAHAQLARQSEQWLAEAHERNDRFASAALSGLGQGLIRHLMRDRPDQADEELRAALSPWPEEPFSLARWGELIAHGYVSLYRGGPVLARWLEQHRERLDAAFLHRTQYGREWLRWLRTLGALARIGTGGVDERAVQLREARQRASHLGALGSPFARAGEALALAQVEALDGRVERAMDWARTARQVGAGRSCFLEMGALYLEGVLAGPDAGGEKREAALDLFGREGWEQPYLAVSMWAPAIRLLGPRAPSVPRRAGLVRRRYRPLSSVGAGGFGSVSYAEDTLTGQRVALKQLVNASPTALARFKQEFRVLQQVHHPNLVRLDALFEHDGEWFIAMEPVDGFELSKWIEVRGGFEASGARSVFRQLAEGLSCLHDAGFVHRDLKPANVCVTPSGRTVLLDFGFVAHTQEGMFDGAPESVGTPAYMAPEQLDGLDMDASADVYAFGVCLFEALCGRLPFEGATPMETMRLKRERNPPDPRSFASHVTEPLARLCLDALACDPRARLTMKQALAVLADDGAPLARSVPESAAPMPLVAGRQHEIEALTQCFETARSGEPVVVLVEGESGVGKTTLVLEAIRQLRLLCPDAWVLSGRCYENEQVPYKAFDGVIDELAKGLRTLPREACQRLLPPRAALLLQLFPVLGSVPAIARAPRKGLPAEPTARRIAGFSALRALLAAVRAERPLVLLIDDLQWSDAESFRLLRALIAEPGAPALMVLATVRSRAELAAEVAAELQVLDGWDCTERLRVDMLAPAMARELARSLLGPEAPEAWPAVIAQESRGHPLLLAELVHYARERREVRETASLTIEAALEERIRALDAEARRLLSFIALGSKPYGTHVLARAMQRSDGLGDLSARLLALRLVRRRGDQELTCFHDMIRQVTVERWVAQDAPALCGALAEALQSETDADPAELARLWLMADDHERAVEAFEQAADQALESLAFSQAERLYARALSLMNGESSERALRITVQRGHSLARGGKSRDAAAAYEQAAGRSQGADAVRLRVLAAQQSIQSAQIDAGMAAAHSVLREVGAPLPEGPVSAISRIIADRVMLGVRGLTVEARPAAQVEPLERLALDAARDLALPVAWVELVTGSALNTRYLRSALKLGDPVHAARALAQEAAFRAMQRAHRQERYQPLFEQSRLLLAGLDEPASEAYRAFMQSTAAAFRWDLREARDLLEAAQEIVNTRCPGEPWLLTNIRMNLGAAWFNSGEHARLARDHDTWLLEAQERDDRFGIAALIGLGHRFLRHLLVDAPDQALSELEAALAPWPVEPFSFARWGQLWALSYVELYRGGPALEAWLALHHARLERASVHRTQYGRNMLQGFRALAKLSALGTASPGAVQAARREALRLGKIETSHAKALSALCLAQVAVLETRFDAARALAGDAHVGFQQSGFVARHAAAYLIGALDGGEGGKARCASVLQHLREQGWQRPERAVAMFLPILERLPP